MAGVWYVYPNRTRVVWATAVVGGLATTEVHRLRVVGGRAITELWRAPGQATSAAAVTQAQGEEDPAPIPARETDPAAPATGGGLTEEQAAQLAAAVPKAKVPTYRFKDEGAGTWPPREAGGLFDIARGTGAQPADAVAGDVHQLVVIEP